MRASKALLTGTLGMVLLLAGSQISVADREIEGTVKAVDVSKSTITLTTGPEGSAKDETLDVVKKTKITSNGQPASLADIKRGQKGIATLNVDLEVVTAFDATGEGMTTLVPEVAQITELPEPDLPHTGPWLSSDGLTLYWKNQAGVSEKGWIWSARREAKDGLFDNAKKHVNGSDMTVTSDGLEMILLVPDGLYSTKRASLTEAFSRPQKIAELQGHGFLAVPCFGADDLTLYVDKSNPKKHAEQVKFTRRSRTGKWTGPTPVKIDLPSGKRIRHFSVTSDGAYGFGILHDDVPGKAFWEVSNQIAVMRAKGGGFGRPIPIWIDGKPLVGTFPRYVCATKELFLNRPIEGKPPQISVVRNFDPETAENAGAEQPAAANADAADGDKQLQGRWVASAGGKYYEVSYPTPDKKQPNMQLDYTIWIPDGAPRLRGIIVHTHGNGSWEAGADAAYDLHWQALAKKWDCALLAPSFHQSRSKEDLDVNWHRYFVPGGGSRGVFLGALHDLAVKSNHPELENVPWCLWGHSAGAIWSGLMHAHDPDRIVAIWLRSQSGWGFAEAGFIPNWKLVPTENNRGVPVILNCGMSPHEGGGPEEDDGRKDALGMLRAFRPKDAPVGIAFDPKTGHNCGDSRLLAIPYFDTMLAMRLPDKGSKDQQLKPVDMKVAWLAESPSAAPGQLPAHASMSAVAAAQYKGDPKQAIWLPNESFAKKWMEYVKTGYVTDTTDPPPPFNVKADRKSNGSVELTWDSEVDLESGLRTFIIMRDGEKIGRTEPVMKRRSATVPIDGRRLFQGLSYHDTPLQPRRAMQFVDTNPPPGKKHAYEVIAVNSEGLKSKPVAARRR